MYRKADIPRRGGKVFGEIVRRGLSRRRVLVGGAAAAVGFLGLGRAPGAAPAVGFAPVRVADGHGPVPVISPDYNYSVLIPWGEPVAPGGPQFRHPPAPDDQARQIGIGHDGMTFFPLGENGSRRGLLAVNHEFGANMRVIGTPAPATPDDVRSAQHAIGAAVVEIEEQEFGLWQPVASRYARRIHARTPIAFSGPAADSAFLRTPCGAAPAGMINNCADGETPWRTWLTCEENIHFYFGHHAGNDFSAAGAPEAPTPAQARYGFRFQPSGYGWERFDPRFDLRHPGHVNEENRFGWVVEIDPFDPARVPVKRTALGRFKHEGAAVTVGAGNRVVVYMGDDERFEYIYKFVSDGDHAALRARGESPLDRGVLYAARFHEDFTGEWLPLAPDNPAVRRAGFTSQAEIVTFARLAADAAGATPMDRPEWAAVAPGGDVYMSLTNNSERRAADNANPRAPNLHGHIVRWRDRGDATGLSFDWDIFLIAEETHGTEASFAAPDGLWADPDGRLFIETDGRQSDGLNNQLLVADTATGAVRRLLTGVTGDEITGIASTPDQRTLFVNVQHPGNGDPRVTNFPVMNAVPDGVTPPRDATLVITRRDGAIVGS